MNRQIQLTSANCKEFINSGKKLKNFIPEGNVTKFDMLEEPNHELQLGFPGTPLLVWSANMFLIVSVDRFIDFPSF